MYLHYFNNLIFKPFIFITSFRFFEQTFDIASKNTSYEDKLTIGDMNVIRNVKSEVVKGFYNKWYHPKHMAVIAVGDFQDTNKIVDSIKEKFDLNPENEFRPLPSIRMPPNS